MIDRESEWDTQRYETFLAERRQALLARIAAASARAGRDATAVELLAVSKTVGVAELLSAYRVGYHSFGENRPQELARKVDAVHEISELSSLRFDMIGNLQKNKINQVLAAAPALIHSISSFELAQAVSKRAEVRDIRANVLLEINVSGEASKSGFSPAEVLACAEELIALPALSLAGVMAMAPAGDPDAARRTFSGLRELRDALSIRMGCPLSTLSCGMSDDFEIAVEEGSTVVRLGRIVFDPLYAEGERIHE